jgi:hypothetical protein
VDILDLDTQTACDESVSVELLSPTDGKSTGIFISVVGKDSKICQDYSRDQIDDALRKAHRAKRRGKDIELQTSAKLKERELDFLVACTTGWSCVTTGVKDLKKTITFGDEELAFSSPNAKKLYKRLPWVAVQMDEAIGDLSLFMKT